MASMALQSIIEGHPQRSQIIEQLVAGIPLRKIASWTNSAHFPWCYTALQNQYPQANFLRSAVKTVNANSISLDDKPLAIRNAQMAVQASPGVRQRAECWYGLKPVT